MTREEMVERLAQRDAQDLVRWAIKGPYEEILAYVRANVLEPLTDAAIETEYTSRYGLEDESGEEVILDDLIAYCNLALDEVCAENCVECQNWDYCEYVTATVIPDLLERMLYRDSARKHIRWSEESRDLVYKVIARLKGNHYASANDV